MKMSRECGTFLIKLASIAINLASVNIGILSSSINHISTYYYLYDIDCFLKDFSQKWISLTI